MFTQVQNKQLSDRGITAEQAFAQLEIFRKGINPVKLNKPCTPDDGIEVYDETEIERYISLFQKEKSHFSMVKFVPASGAASRMFKALFEAYSDLLEQPSNSNNLLSNSPEIAGFFKSLKDYPFYDDLNSICKAHKSDLETLLKSGKFADILNFLLSDNGLSYGSLPKGLLKFHKYRDETRTAFEEHFSEASQFLADRNNNIKIHFTVSPEHLKLFKELSNKLINKYLEKYYVKFLIEFSVQKPSTDTLAVNMNNEPFIQQGGLLHFRPGGHGALLENMQDLIENFIFISNIDNVSPDHNKGLRIRYKELLAGILIERVKKIHSFLSTIEHDYTENLRNEITDFTGKYISSSISKVLAGLNDSDFKKYVFLQLNKPIRICGMVKNVGEPGGGPFWITDSEGNISKQIIESSQVNLNNAYQSEIFKKATHFNPVDLVCYIFDYKGRKFRLEDFRDPGMAFIAIKSQGGSSLKALELPGLWNGSMAGWLTFFVDVPVETFSPVKTVFDLLRKEHTS